MAQTLVRSPAAGFPTAGAGRTVRAVARVLLDVVVAIAVLLLVFLAIGPRLLPYQTVTMLTGSMRPGIPPGSVVVETSEPVGALRAGQVISFHTPQPGHPVVTHRVVEVLHRNDQVLVRTRGDANSGVDPWIAAVHGDRVWRVRTIIPHLGSALRVLRRPGMRVLVGFVAPAALLGWLLAGIWRRPGGGVNTCEPSGLSAYPSSSPRHASASPGRRSRLSSQTRRQLYP